MGSLSDVPGQALCTEHHSSAGTGRWLGAGRLTGCRRVTAGWCSSRVSTGAAFHLTTHQNWQEVVQGRVGDPKVNGVGRGQRTRHSRMCGR